MEPEKVRAIITGVTGMVGEGVLHECLLSNHIAEVLVVNRRPCGITHPKLKEILHADFFDLSAIENGLKGYNACYFCLGVSSVGMPADTYYHLTYDLTLNFALMLSRLNPDMVFCYISGANTDSTEKGRIRRARIKGKTENDLARLPFRSEYNFRPGALIPSKGAKNVNKYYKWFAWLVPVVKLVFPDSINTLKQLGEAMLQVTLKGYDKTIIEVRDIKILSERYH